MQTFIGLCKSPESTLPVLSDCISSEFIDTHNLTGLQVAVLKWNWTSCICRNELRFLKLHIWEKIRLQFHCSFVLFSARFYFILTVPICVLYMHLCVSGAEPGGLRRTTCYPGRWDLSVCIKNGFVYTEDSVHRDSVAWRSAAFRCTRTDEKMCKNELHSRRHNNISHDLLWD